MSGELIHRIEKIDAVMMPCPDDFHGQGKIQGKFSVPAAEHVQVVAEVPYLLAAVPFPVGIRVGIMPERLVCRWVRFLLYVVAG